MIIYLSGIAKDLVRDSFKHRMKHIMTSFAYIDTEKEDPIITRFLEFKEDINAGDQKGRIHPAVRKRKSRNRIKRDA